jgi:hypothetical protein
MARASQGTSPKHDRLLRDHGCKMLVLQILVGASFRPPKKVADLAAMFRFLMVVAMVGLSCGNPALIDGSAYKTSCSTVSDCAAVYFGDQCSMCACPNGAISVSQKVLYEADRSAALATCGARPAVACAACETRALTCESGVCGLK